MSEIYWNELDYKKLEQAGSYADLSLIALGILPRMPQPITQVCGPISTGGAGSIEANLKRFAETIEALKDEGYTVFDQMPFEESLIRVKALRKCEGYDTDLLTEFYLPIFESGHISSLHFMPDWESSFGAKWEHEQASRLHIEIVYRAA